MISKKETVKFILLLTIATVIIAITILLFCWVCYLLPIDFPGTVGEWITAFSALAGGALTLGGVWWTIKNQEDKRREDLSIPFKPIITLTIPEIGDTYRNNPYRDFNRNYEEEKTVLPICFKLKNSGSGKAFNLSYSEAYIKFSNTLPIETQLDVSGPTIGSLDINQEMEIRFKFINIDRIPFDNTEFTIVFSINYTDIYGYRNKTNFEYKTNIFFNESGFTYCEGYGELLSTVKFNSKDKVKEIPLKGGSLTTIPKKPQ